MSELKNKTIADIEAMMKDKKMELQAFRFGTAGSTSKNVKAGKGLKKDIARMLTEVNARRTK
jgi:ribosomal protein L29